MSGLRLPVAALLLVALVAIGYSTTARMPELKAGGSFWSDEATYHSMAYSLAFDGDIRYERGDLERVYAAGYSGGPSGLFLVRNPNSGELYFSKAWAYSLAAAPFVRFLGDNGFVLLHALLLGLMLAAGYAYLRRGSREEASALHTLTFLLGSVLPLYFFWMTPEWFNASLTFLATFLWLYKEEIPGSGPEERPRRFAWLAAGWTDWAAALLYGVAIFSKPPNLLLVCPLLLWTALRGRWGRAILLGVVCAAVIVALFGATWAAIGDWNYQGGDRRTFNVLTSYPYLQEGRGFAETGIEMATDVSDFAAAVPPPATLLRDLVYVLVGRNGGLLPYMFPALVALALFLAAPSRSWRGPHALLVAFWLLEILAIVLLVKGNWIGGGGTIGSRYFVNVYPLLFFVLPAGLGLASALVSWVIWGFFLAQVVLNPFVSSANPSFHTKSLPYTMLPAELTILHNLPFNTSSRARLVQLDDPATFLTYFLDDNTYLREADTGGFWLRGGTEAEIVLRTIEPIETISLQIRNRTRANRVVVRHGSQVVDRVLRPNERLDLRLAAQERHDYSGTSLYRLSVFSETGTIPLFDAEGSGDSRVLGVFVRPRVEPARAFRR